MIPVFNHTGDSGEEEDSNLSFILDDFLNAESDTSSDSSSITGTYGDFIFHCPNVKEPLKLQVPPYN